MSGTKRMTVSCKEGSEEWKVSYSQRQRWLSPEPEEGLRSKEHIWLEISGDVRRSKDVGDEEKEVSAEGGVGRIEINESKAACAFVGEEGVVVVVVGVGDDGVSMEGDIGGVVDGDEGWDLQGVDILYYLIMR